MTDTTTLTGVPVDAAPPLQAVVNLIADAEAAAASALAQAAVDAAAATAAQADAANLKTLLAADDATIEQLREIVAQQSKTVFGAAATSDTTFAKLGCDSLRMYEGEGVIPARFALTRKGVTNHVELSLKPHHPPNPQGFDQDAAVIQFVTSAVAVCKVAGLHLSIIFIHEPEQAGKQPADAPAPYAAAVVHYVKLVRAKFPDLEYGVCFMAYTFNQRPGYKGTNPWLVAVVAAAKAAGVVLDFFALDGYSTANNNHASAAVVFGPNIAYIRAMVPSAEIRIAEWGSDATGQARADHITAGIPWLVAQGVTAIYYFCESQWDITGDPVSLAAWQAGIGLAA
jgi:hypothetical protein